jgi:hypothetical protein
LAWRSPHRTGFAPSVGFPTEAAALLWVAEQTAREANASGDPD